MATDTGFGKVKIFDDFLGVGVDESNNWLEGTGSAGSSAINVDDNGYYRMSGGTGNGNVESWGGAVIWEAENGGIIFEWRGKNVTDILTRALFIGLTDVSVGTTLENPAEMNGTTLTATAANCVGFMYDTDANNDYWYCASSKAVKTTPVNTSVAPKITDQTLRIVLNVDGDATFSIDGKYEGKIDNAVTASTKLCPIVCIENRLATTSRSLDTDYIYIEGGRS